MKKIAFVISVIGILVILFFANNLNAREGVVGKILISEEFTRVELISENMTLVVFDEVSGIEVGDKIRYSGREEYYDGQTEFIVEKIIILPGSK